MFQREHARSLLLLCSTVGVLPPLESESLARSLARLQEPEAGPINQSSSGLNGFNPAIAFTSRPAFRNDRHLSLSLSEPNDVKKDTFIFAMMVSAGLNLGRARGRFQPIYGSSGLTHTFPQQKE